MLTVPFSMVLWSGTPTGPSESSMVRLCPWDLSALGTEAPPVCSLFCPYRALLHYWNTNDSVIQHLLLYSCCLQSSPRLHQPVCCCPKYSPLAPADPPAPLSILLCLHVLLHQASFPSGFPLGLASEKPNMRQGGARRVGLEYLFSCLTPYKVILGALSTRLSPSGFQQSVPPLCPIGPFTLAHRDYFTTQVTLKV